MAEKKRDEARLAYEQEKQEFYRKLNGTARGLESEQLGLILIYFIWLFYRTKETEAKTGIDGNASWYQ